LSRFSLFIAVVHCHQVLDGELAQRAEATRRLREVQKQLMLLGGFVPPSPVVTAAAAAHAAAADRASGGGDAGVASLLPREDVLQREAARLQDSIERRSTNIKVCCLDLHYCLVCHSASCNGRCLRGTTARQTILHTSAGIAVIFCNAAWLLSCLLVNRPAWLAVGFGH